MAREVAKFDQYGIDINYEFKTEAEVPAHPELVEAGIPTKHQGKLSEISRYRNTAGFASAKELITSMLEELAPTQQAPEDDDDDEEDQEYAPNKGLIEDEDSGEDIESDDDREIRNRKTWLAKVKRPESPAPKQSDNDENTQTDPGRSLTIGSVGYCVSIRHVLKLVPSMIISFIFLHRASRFGKGSISRPPREVNVPTTMTSRNVA